MIYADLKNWIITNKYLIGCIELFNCYRCINVVDLQIMLYDEEVKKSKLAIQAKKYLLSIYEKYK